MTGAIWRRLGFAKVAAACLVLAMLVTTRTILRAQSGCAPEEFTAAAVNRGPSAILLAPSVDIHIGRWSTEAEKTHLARSLLDHGTATFLTDLRATPPIGHIRTPITFPYDVYFAWQEPLDDGGRRIIAIADRPLIVWTDAMQLPASHEVFTVIELRVPLDGEGEGKVAIGSNIHVNRSLDLIEIENFDAEPVRLIEVRAKRSTSLTSDPRGRR